MMIAAALVAAASLAAQLGAPAIGMVGYNPDPQGLDAVFDGIKKVRTSPLTTG
jgi:hypothetical protein